MPSPKVATYDLKPEMSALEVTDKLVEAIRSAQVRRDRLQLRERRHGRPHRQHRGGEAGDRSARRLPRPGRSRHMREAGGEVLITADHGNAEMMPDPATSQPHTAHTLDRVPFVYVGRRGDACRRRRAAGRRADAAADDGPAAAGGDDGHGRWWSLRQTLDARCFGRQCALIGYRCAALRSRGRAGSPTRRAWPSGSPTPARAAVTLGASGERRAAAPTRDTAAERSDARNPRCKEIARPARVASPRSRRNRHEQADAADALRESERAISEPVARSTS